MSVPKRWWGGVEEGGTSLSRGPSPAPSCSINLNPLPCWQAGGQGWHSSHSSARYGTDKPRRGAICCRGSTWGHPRGAGGGAGALPTLFWLFEKREVPRSAPRWLSWEGKARLVLGCSCGWCLASCGIVLGHTSSPVSQREFCFPCGSAVSGGGRHLEETWGS